MESQIHGALVEVLGIGVLLKGTSGVGKSECALELVQRGHKLVADDVVRIHAESGAASGDAVRGAGTSVLIGQAPELIRHYMEIRGIGLLYIPDLYGAEAVASRARIELICHLEQWRDDVDYERIGLERPTENLMGAAIPALVLPLRPARSIATLVEVAVRDALQRRRGNNAAERLDARMRGSMDEGLTGGGSGQHGGGR